MKSLFFNRIHVLILNILYVGIFLKMSCLTSYVILCSNCFICSMHLCFLYHLLRAVNSIIKWNYINSFPATVFHCLLYKDTPQTTGSKTLLASYQLAQLTGSNTKMYVCPYEKQKYSRYSLSYIHSITDAVVYVFHIKILTKLPNLLTKTPPHGSFPFQVTLWFWEITHKKITDSWVLLTLTKFKELLSWCYTIFLFFKPPPLDQCLVLCQFSFLSTL